VPLGKTPAPTLLLLPPNVVHSLVVVRPQRIAGEVSTYDASDLVYYAALLCDPGVVPLVTLLDTDSPVKRIQIVTELLRQRTTELEVASSIQEKVRGVGVCMHGHLSQALVALHTASQGHGVSLHSLHD
jgi:hypothetical protein